MFPTNREITSFGKTVKFPGVDENGEFTNGDFSNPDVPPSFLDAATQNLVIGNLNALVEKLSGQEANNTDRNQLAALFTVAATALRGVQRDENGRAKVAAPVADDDIARKKEIDDIINGVVELKKLTVLGDIIQKGTNKITHAEDVYTKQAMIHLREGAVAALASGDLVGFIAELYDGAKNGVLGFDKDGTARVGDEGDTQPLATRAESAEMTGGGLVGWNAQKQRLESHSGYKHNGLQGDADRTNYTTCSTAAGTQAKTCDCTGFNLVTGAEITVKFTVTNTAASPTLNVNSTGAKTIFYRGAAISADYLAANRTYTFRYNGSQYELVGDINTDTNTTYSAATQSAQGLMSAADKKKLDGIASGANAYSHPTGAGNNHIPAGGSAGQILRWSAEGTAAWGADNNTTYGEASTSAAGLMSATDKSRLNNNYVTASNFGTSSGYVKYSNGLLIQYGVIPEGRGDTRVDILSYSNTTYAIVVGGQSNGAVYNHNKTNNSFYLNIDGATNEKAWLTIGY